MHARALTLLALAGTAGIACSPGDQAPMLVGVAVTPQQASVRPLEGIVFSADVSGAPATGVTWSVTETGGGTIDASGYYAAPGSPGTYHVVATSVADRSRSATATVSVSTAAAAGGLTISS